MAARQWISVKVVCASSNNDKIVIRNPGKVLENLQASALPQQYQGPYRQPRESRGAMSSR
jgi:hypothetical protein